MKRTTTLAMGIALAVLGTTPILAANISRIHSVSLPLVTADDVLSRESVSDPGVHTIDVSRYRQPLALIESLTARAIGGPSFVGRYVAFLVFERGGYTYTVLDQASETFYTARIDLRDDLSGFSELLDVHMVNPVRISASEMEDQLRAQTANVQATAATLPTGFGKILGTVNGVNVYSNGPSSLYVSNLRSDYGIKWQCVEFVRRYYAVKFNRSISSGDAPRYFTHAADYGLKAYPNGGSIAPKVGDLLVSTVGHVGVIISVVLPTSTKAGTVKVAHQNWPNEATRTLALTSRVWTDSRGPNIAFSVAGFNSTYPVAGWSR